MYLYIYRVYRAMRSALKFEKVQLFIIDTNYYLGVLYCISLLIVQAVCCTSTSWIYSKSLINKFFESKKYPC